MFGVRAAGYDEIIENRLDVDVSEGFTRLASCVVPERRRVRHCVSGVVAIIAGLHGEGEPSMGVSK